MQLVPDVSWRESVWEVAFFSAASGREVQASKHEFSVPSGALDLSQSHNLNVQGFCFVLFSCLVKTAQRLRKIIGFDVGSKFLAQF